MSANVIRILHNITFSKNIYKHPFSLTESIIFASDYYSVLYLRCYWTGFRSPHLHIAFGKEANNRVDYCQSLAEIRR